MSEEINDASFHATLRLFQGAVDEAEAEIASLTDRLAAVQNGADGDTDAWRKRLETCTEIARQYRLGIRALNYFRTHSAD